MFKDFRFPTSTNSTSKDKGKDTSEGRSSASDTSGQDHRPLARGESSSAEDLPHGWKSITSRSTNKTYYLHETSGATQWDKPTVSPSDHHSNSINKTKNVAGEIKSKAAKFGVDLSSGLTNMFNQAKTKLATDKTTPGAVAGLLVVHAPIGPSDFERAFDSTGRTVVSEIFEYDRLTGGLGPQDPKRFGTRDALVGLLSDELPHDDDDDDDHHLPPGYVWTSREWLVDATYANCDEQGWTYGQDFNHIIQLYNDSRSHGERAPVDVVRRRRWIRFRQLEDHPSLVESVGRKSSVADIVNDGEKQEEEEEEEEEERTLDMTTKDNREEDENENENHHHHHHHRGDDDDDDDDGVDNVVDEDTVADLTNNKQNQGNAVNPFVKTKSNSTSNLFQKFGTRGGKDHTKEYQKLNVSTLEWLVDDHLLPVPSPGSSSLSSSNPLDHHHQLATSRSNHSKSHAENDESSAARTLEQSIQLASRRASEVEKKLHKGLEKTEKSVTAYQDRLKGMATNYVKMKDSYSKLLQSNADIQKSVDKLKTEVEEMDMAINEEQRAINAELEAENQMLTEKLKALSSARMRYKQDNESLSKAYKEATSESSNSSNSHEQSGNMQNELAKAVRKITDARATLEQTQELYARLEEEKQNLLNQPGIERKKGNHDKGSTSKALEELDDQIGQLKETQKQLIKFYGENTDPAVQHQIDQRRDAIRHQLSALRERRIQLKNGS